MPGYSLATSDKESIDPKYLCNSCGLLLREAMQTACGHFYCRSCLGNLFMLVTLEFMSLHVSNNLSLPICNLVWCCRR